MYTTPAYRVSAPRHADGRSAFGSAFDHGNAERHATASHPQDIRPLITRHRLRKQRRRKAATLLTGASIALGVAALRPPSASAQSTRAPAVPITHIARHPTHEQVPVRHASPERPSAEPHAERDWIPSQPP